MTGIDCIRRLTLSAFVVLAVACSPLSLAGPQADVVFYGEHIYSVDPAHPEPEAVAIRGGEIFALGTREAVARTVGGETRVVELGERALVPGFIDAHGHFSLVMQVLPQLNASSPPVGPMESVEDIITAIRARIAERAIPPGQIVMGYGYDDSLLAENRHPTRDDLDRASTLHPIALLHVSGHLMTANSLALEQAGITERSEDPTGGVIRRRPGTREPNGVLEETATYPFRAMAAKMGAKLSDRDRTNAVRATVDYHASYGVTTIQDGAVTPDAVCGDSRRRRSRAAGRRSRDVSDLPPRPARRLDRGTRLHARVRRMASASQA